jgi:aspartate/methionine/tyrosine aminotransferase
MTRARATYTSRRSRVVEILTANDVDVTGSDGINLWVAVEDERSAVVGLAARGVGVAPGGPFLVRPDSDHIRVTVGLLADDAQLADVSEHIAAAATSHARRGHRTAAHR